MSQDPTKAAHNEDVKKLAQTIVEYETKDKGFIDEVFGFESRDGIWSKLAKVVGPTLSALGAAAMVLSVASGPVGIAAAAAAGLVSAAVSRFTNSKIISDMHDSQEGAIGKFGHYATSVVVGAVGSVAANIGIGLIMPPMAAVAATATSLVLANTLTPAIDIAASMGVSATLGNQKLIRTSTEAREIARKAIESGQSVEQVMHHEHTVNTLATKAPSHAHANEHGHDHGKHFAHMVEQQRGTEHSHSI